MRIVQLDAKIVVQPLIVLYVKQTISYLTLFVIQLVLQEPSQIIKLANNVQKIVKIVQVQLHAQIALQDIF